MIRAGFSMMFKSKWNKLRQTIRKGIDKILVGNHNHYLCQLPDRMDFFSRALLKLFSSRIKIEENQTALLNGIPKGAIVVFAAKNKWNFEYLFYHTRYKRLGHTFPEIGFDYRITFWQPLSRMIKIILSYIDYFIFNLSIPNPYKSGFIEQQLLNGKAAFLSLIDKRSFYQRFVKDRTDPIQHLIEIQHTTDRPIIIIPLLMFFDKNPERSVPGFINTVFGTKGNPGRIRRTLTLLINPKHMFVEISEPVNLKAYVSDSNHENLSTKHLSFALRRKLAKQIDRHRQSITGPQLKSRDELKETILTSDRLQQFMHRYAKSRSIPLQQVHKEADECLEELAADYRVGLVKVASIIVRKLIRLMFEEVSVNTDGLDRVKTKAQKGPLILLPCHKSHIDYLLLSSLLYDHNMPAPHVAAGQNLSFWPMGTLFRAGGAFFIRRTFRGARLYSRVFSEYIFKLLDEGFNIEFFLEGTRSRTGKLIMPKLGLLSILLNAFRNGACEDMIFVPIFIGYDQVLEESAYLDEIEGGQKKPENFIQVIKARRFLKKRHGRIYIRFHDPLSLKELLSDQGQTIKDMTTKEQNRFCRNLAYRVLSAIDSVAVVTPQALFASAVLNCSRQRFSFDQVRFYFDTYYRYLISQKVDMSEALTVDHDLALRQLLDAYVQLKFIEKISEEKDGYSVDTLFRINENKRPILEYYKNNCISYFVSPAFTALSILEIDAFEFSVEDLCAKYGFLQQLFQNEFAYSETQSEEHLIRKNLNAFAEDGVLVLHPENEDTYKVTPTGLKKLRLYSSFLKTYLESYWVALNYFMRSSQNSIDPKERLKKVQGMGNRMYKRNEIELKEALSKVNYDNAINFYLSNGVKGSENSEKIKYYADEIQKYMKRFSIQ